MTDTPAATTPTYLWGVGRRKAAVARVRLKPNGTGRFFLQDKRTIEQYFTREQDRLYLMAPLQLTATQDKVDVYVNVRGGGVAGQAGAIRLGITRALLKLDPSHQRALKDAGYLTRDARAVERKKPGKAGARRSYQFSKR